jgi:hypothetical protein
MTNDDLIGVRLRRTDSSFVIRPFPAMPAANTPNADLEQSLFKANLKETRLRHRAFLALLLPVGIGAAWLVYSLVVVTRWEAQSRAVAEREAEIVKREADSQQKVADADARRDTAEGLVEGAQEQEKAAKARTADIEQRLVKVREEVGVLGTLQNEVSAAKLKASKLNASEAVESQLTEIRVALGKTLARIEQEIDKGLPTAEQKARVYLFIADDSQRTAARSLAEALEKQGYDVPPIARSVVKRDGTEVRYFRDPADRAEAARIQELVAKQTGQTEAKVTRGSDPDSLIGSRKFHVSLSKPPPPVASGR